MIATDVVILILQGRPPLLTLRKQEAIIWGRLTWQETEALCLIACKVMNVINNDVCLEGDPSPLEPSMRPQLD